MLSRHIEVSYVLKIVVFAHKGQSKNEVFSSILNRQQFCATQIFGNIESFCLIVT